MSKLINTRSPTKRSHIVPTPAATHRPASFPTRGVSCHSLVLMVIAIVLALAGLAASAPITMSNLEVQKYLARFGYLPQSAGKGNLIHIDEFHKAIKDFQEFAQINVTGVADELTLELMQTPRCGVKDKIPHGDRVKRYALQGSRWTVKNLIYRISHYPKRLSRNETDAEVKRAFAVWSEFTSLTFKQAETGAVHIDIRFVEGAHGDGDPFDGKGGTLAHAYFPSYGGNAHFDDAESWTVKQPKGTNLFQVAAHEFGHSLGLLHSDVHEALMAPFYRGYQPNFKLHKDDISAIQALYGTNPDKNKLPSYTAKPTITRSTTVKAVRGDDPICTHQQIDTIFKINNQVYAFKGSMYYLLKDDRIAPGYPKPISQRWPELPDNIDAAFSYKNERTYFFKGPLYWHYQGTTLKTGYPRYISEGFPGIPDDVDAAFMRDHHIYFFKGSRYWRFDPYYRTPVTTSYPKHISVWKGVPSNINAVLSYTDDKLFFFKGEKYYRFSTQAFAVDEEPIPYPRPIGPWWFGCPNSPRTGNEAENIEESLEMHSSYSINDETEDLDFVEGTDDQEEHDESNVQDMSRKNKSGAAALKRNANTIFGKLYIAMIVLVLPKLLAR